MPTIRAWAACTFPCAGNVQPGPIVFLIATKSFATVALIKTFKNIPLILKFFNTYLFEKCCAVLSTKYIFGHYHSCIRCV